MKASTASYRDCGDKDRMGPVKTTFGEIYSEGDCSRVHHRGAADGRGYKKEKNSTVVSSPI